MKTNPQIYLQSSCQKNARLLGQLEKVRSQVKTTISNLNNSLSTIAEALETSYTDYSILLKKDVGGWKSVGIIDMNDIPEDLDEEWDLILPIPNPETIPEFSGF